MGFSYCAYLIRTSDEGMEARKVDSRATPLTCGFVCLGRDSWPDWTVAGSTKDFSIKFGEAWFLVADSTSGVFAYEHGKNGEIIRSLAYTGDEGWILAEGNPEEWESVLFNDRQKFFAGDMIRDEPDKQQWKKELADLEAGILQVGNMLPIADATLIQLIARKIGTEIQL